MPDTDTDDLVRDAARRLDDRTDDLNALAVTAVARSDQDLSRTSKGCHAILSFLDRATDEQLDRFFHTPDNPAGHRSYMASVDAVRRGLARLESRLIFLRSAAYDEAVRTWRAGYELDREVLRRYTMARPDLDWSGYDELYADVFTIRVGPVAYLRAMAALLWSAVRHPLSETTIDLSTGRVLYRT